MGCVLSCSRDQGAISTTQKTHTQPHPRTSREKTKSPPPQKKTTSKKKRKQRHFDGPRKGRKESFTKYIPGYVPTVSVEDPELFGVFDAVEYVDPYTIAREELQHPSKPVVSPEQIPTNPIIDTSNRTSTHANVIQTRQTYQEQSCTSSQKSNHYYSDNVYLYESEHHGQNDVHHSGHCHIENSTGYDDNGRSDGCD